MMLRGIGEFASDAILIRACIKKKLNLFMLVLIKDGAIVGIADMHMSNETKIMLDNLRWTISL